ncbi:hypothetical protein B0H13DRAFT_2355921 [Mycena leptocephala]|nr:hypothetical protein B0H13DRAFT_2355921 [Mycena leptocephala]
MSDTSAVQKATIVALKDVGMSNRQVADKENVAPSTMSRINARYGPTHDFDSKAPKKGRPSKLDERDEREAVNVG